ncbi:element excision factor XisH family protein [Nostoc sp. DSM 114167]|uniref:element excision factor XisH family protein n=1 Tax=Nostoc sp. DSM 114167 TaxID=3439050 RepID=UPI0040453FB8
MISILVTKVNRLGNIVNISQDTYQDFFSRQFIQDSLKEYQIKLLIFNSLSQDIVLWKE